MKLTGRWFPQIVDRDSGNLYPSISTLVPLDSTYGAPDPPKNKKKLITNFYQITSIFCMLLEDSFGVKSISRYSWGLEAYIKKCS